jgi:hypothetical protein
MKKKKHDTEDVPLNEGQSIYVADERYKTHTEKMDDTEIVNFPIY